MTNIWGFVIQTLEVSLMAMILLGMKWIMRDKLSPRWQYGIWSLLFLCMLVPAGYFGSYILPYLNVCIEAIKIIVEQLLHSAYIQSYELITNHSFLPWIVSFPHSLTDYLFVVYVLGVLFCMIRYVIHYMLLKKMLTQAYTSSKAEKQVINICENYGLKRCRVVCLENLPSAFVFGVIKPVLVLPYNKETDDKVILHELLHLKYHDVLQNVIWSFMKCLHWCNPFIHYIFQVIHNDMESLCDQRVLELLEGEERREYGRILLSMIDENYPHAFMTSSLSNGGKCIKKRIEAIARFKKYPQGMALVSICIGLLFVPLATGNITATFALDHYHDDQNFTYYTFLASARMNQSSSLMEAIDKYVHGLVFHNYFEIISVMPDDQQKNYQAVISVMQNEYSHTQIASSNYSIVNLQKEDAQTYYAYLLFESYIDYNEIDDLDEEEKYIDYVIIPVKLQKEKGWKVQQDGEFEYGQALTHRIGLYHFVGKVPTDRLFTYKISEGQLNVTIQNGYIIGDSIESVLPYQAVSVTYQGESYQDVEQIGLRIENMENVDEYQEDQFLWGQNGGSASNDYSHESQSLSSNEWQQNPEYSLTHVTYGYTSSFFDEYHFPQGYHISLMLNGETVDDVKVDLREDESVWSMNNIDLLSGR